MSNVQSIVTPATNGAIHAKGKGKAKAQAKASTAMTRRRLARRPTSMALSMAGLDGTLTVAIKTFKDNETVMADMLTALNVGYLVRKMGYDKAKATEVVGLLKFSEKKQDDHHRTFEQQRVMDTVRVVWHRAQKMAGVVKAKTEGQIKAEATRAEKEAAAEAHESRLIKADANRQSAGRRRRLRIADSPCFDDEVDSGKARRKACRRRGSAWRDWLASAPKA